MPSPLQITVFLPCHNEEPAIGKLVRELKALLPTVAVVVVDNGSTDNTSDAALKAGATVLTEPRLGKANAYLAAVEWIDSDVLVMVDGDGSYPARAVEQALLEYIRQPVDLLTGVRSSSVGSAAFRPMHQAGNAGFAHAFSLVMGERPADLFSGLRVMSRRFYKNVPILSNGFELELELTLQAIDKGYFVSEHRIEFGEREQGTASKLQTFRDGFRILWCLLKLFRDYKPHRFFGVIAGFMCMLGLLAGSLPVYEYILTSRVGRFPLAGLAAALEIIAALAYLFGLSLESTRRTQREAFQRQVRACPPGAAEMRLRSEVTVLNPGKNETAASAVSA
ncbi:MAG: glycosyltransferase family 2 protein [Candidatus Methylacidiphilales bacterium]|nr:glycosyltransferase family 2 protein [Candidatus Methylacidiphilales bacterium]